MPASPSTPSRLRRLDVFLRPHRRAMLLALAAMLAGSLVLLPAALVQGWALDHLVRGDVLAPAALLLTALAVTIGCHLGRLALVWQGTAIMNRVSLEVVRELTDALHRKLQRLPLDYFDHHPTGQLMARITSDVGTLLIFLGCGSLQLASDLVLAAGITAVLFWLSWPLALVCLAVVPLYALTHRLFAARIHALSALVRDQIGAVYGLLSERISAVRIVRSFAQEEAELARLDEHIEAHRSLGRASLLASAAQGSLATFSSGLGTAAVLVAGVVLLRREQLSVGELLAASALAAQLYNPIARLVQMQGGAAATRVAIDRMLEVLDAPETLADAPRARALSAPQGRLHFQDVSFRYRPEGPWVLRHVSLVVEPGMTLGVLGPSGAGKSTLLALAPRLYDAEAGRILFDGRDVRRLRLSDLRRSAVLVPQQAVLFEGTLRSNLLYANPAAAPGSVHRILDALDLSELVESLPLGLDSPVGERGVSLSGGQRQRLALARALLAEPALLLLDDCTSALDAETEAHVQSAIEELLPGRTRIIVSHKLSSVCRADWLVVLEDGRLVEQGRPADVLDRRGFFAPTQRLQILSADD